MITVDLYTTADIAKVRALLTKEQNNKSAMTGLPLDKPVVDHLHDSEQLVRAVINSSENVALGRIEGLYARYVGYWYEGTYPEFLRLVADYIERGVDRRYRHNGFIKKLLTIFSALPEGKKDDVLKELGSKTGKNGMERKKLFNACILSRQFSYNQLITLLKKYK